MPSRDEPVSELCYLDADHVTSPAGVLSELDVVTASGEQLGTIAGVVIEASARRARYLDVRSRGLRRQHYLVQTDHLAQVDAARKELRLLSSEVPEERDVRSERLRPYSDDDLMAALFTSRVA